MEKLKRDELIRITDNFIKKMSSFEIFEIPDKLYLDYFYEMEYLLNNSLFETDNRFVTYGRLDFLRQELKERLNDKSLEKPALIFKKKWDNRLGAFWDLSDFIKGDRYIAQHQIPQGMDFASIITLNNQYYEDGYICKEERNILLEMIMEIKKFIKEKSNDYVYEYEYEFVPYKRIASMMLDKTSEDEYQPDGVPFLYENGLNHVLCKAVAIDHPGHTHKDKKHVYILVNNKKIELTCIVDKFINELKSICDDVEIIDDDSDANNRWKHIYSNELGIIADANLFPGDIEFYIQSIKFVGKDVFDNIINEYKNEKES